MPEVSFPRLRARTQRFTLGEPRSITVSEDGSRVLFLRAAAGDDPRTGLWCFDVTTGEERPVIRAAADERLTDAERTRRERTREAAAGVTTYAADAAGSVAAVALAGLLHVADVEAGSVTAVPGTEGCFDPRPDPTGDRIAFVAGRALRVVDGSGTDLSTLAEEPQETVSWGRAEFVAAEEMDRVRGFWWSPDGSGLLAARVDESEVPVWWIADPAHPQQPPAAVRYPAAGTTNASVTLHWISADGAERREIGWPREEFPYLARVSWTIAGPAVIQVVSRDQQTTQFRTLDVGTGETTCIAVDTHAAWVDVFAGVPLFWDGQLVRIADRDGTRGLYVGDQRVTPDTLYVRSVSGASGLGVVFTASDGDPTSIGVYRYDGRRIEPIVTDPGVHTALVGGPTVVVASAGMEGDGAVVSIRSAEIRQHRLESFAIRPPVQPQVRMLRLGPLQLAAGLLLPRNQEPGQRLPVLLDPYGGPGSQRVLAARRLWLEPQWIADQGFAVLVVDGRGTPGRSPAWEREVRLDLATKVLADQVDALNAAAEIEPDLDLTRVGIRGWSFGGFLAALAVLRRPDVFAAAVAGAPVTDWSLYDTYYTERFLGTPQEQPGAYRVSSLLDDAPQLRRPLLVVHGLADDNVVAAHTLRLSQRLTECGRPHQVIPLTGVTHMTPQEAVAENLLLLQVDFLHRHLGPPS